MKHDFYAQVVFHSIPFQSVPRALLDEDSDLDAGDGQHLPHERSALADDVANQGLGHSDLAGTVNIRQKHNSCKQRSGN